MNIIFQGDKPKKRKREDRFGSTDLPGLAGTSYFKGEYDVFMNRTSPDYREHQESKPKDLLQLGLDMEPALGPMVARKLREKWNWSGILKPAKTKFYEVTEEGHEATLFRVTPDYIGLCGPRGRKPQFCVELKLVVYKDMGDWGDEWSGEVPQGYKDQAVLESFACDTIGTYVAAFFWFKQELKVYFVEADTDRAHELILMGVKFDRNHVQPNIPPSPDASGACDFFMKKQEQLRPEMLEANQEQTNRMFALKASMAEESKAAKNTARLKNEVKKDIGDAAGMIYENWGKITYKTSAKGTRTFRATLKEPTDTASLKQHVKNTQKEVEVHA